MKKHTESHLDHNLTAAQIEHVMQRFADRAAFFIDTFTLPRELGTVPCGLYGPLMGDAPIDETEVVHEKRGTRAWSSRLIDRPARQQHELTVIAGPHEEKCANCEGRGLFHTGSLVDGTHPCTACGGLGKIQHACILYTAFGGPLAPQEPGDVRRQLEALEEKRRPFLRTPGSPEHDAIYTQIVALRVKRDASDAFWRVHALSKVAT